MSISCPRSVFCMFLSRPGDIGTHVEGDLLDLVGVAVQAGEAHLEQVVGVGQVAQVHDDHLLALLPLAVQVPRPGGRRGGHKDRRQQEDSHTHLDRRQQEDSHTHSKPYEAIVCNCEEIRRHGTTKPFLLVLRTILFVLRTFLDSP